jgi:hypothetical protein
MGNEAYEPIAARLKLTVERAYKLLDQAKARLKNCLRQTRGPDR